MAQVVENQAYSYAQQYQDKQKTLDEILEAYNKAAIRIQRGKADSAAFNDIFGSNEEIYEKLKTQTGVEESYFDMLYDLMQDNKITPAVFDGLSSANSISRRTREDLDKLYEAYMNEEDVLQKFVPKFRTKEEALLNIPVGEVCQIGENEHISIKTKDDNIEDMFLTPQTYFELFPPIERFATHQNRQGDCYLLASIDNIYQNPSTRHLILRLFKENPDNTVDMVWQGWKKEGDKVVPAGFYPVVKDIQKHLEENSLYNKERLSETCEAFRAIEILNAQSAIVDSKEIIKERVEEIKNSNRSTFNYAGDVTLSEKEREMFVKLAEKKDNTLVCLSKKDYTVYIDKEKTKKLYKELEDKNDFISEYTKLVIERLLPYFDEHRGNDFRLSPYEILPLGVVGELTDEFYPTKLSFYNYSGYATDVFRKMARFDKIELGSLEKYKNELFQKDINKRAVFAACSKYETLEHNILDDHAYSIEPIDTEQGRMFVVRNPHNANNERIFDYNTLKKCFTHLYMAMDPK